jgi:peptidoglycan/LPS O-acetylase OafA/YrhL
MVLLTVFLVGPSLSTLSVEEYFSHQTTWKYLWENCTIIINGVAHFLPGMFATNPFENEVNGSLWTLNFEMGCYIVVALFWLITLKAFKGNRTAMTTLIICLTLLALILFYFGKMGEIRDRQSYRLYFFFFCGSTMFMLAKHIALKHSLALLTASLITVCVIVAPQSFHYIYTPLLGYLTLYVAYVPGGFLRQFNRVGDYSYGIYIYAFITQQSLVYLMPTISIPQMIAYASVITLACAMLSWHLIEKKALSYK